MLTVCIQYAKHKSKYCTVFADVHNDESLVLTEHLMNNHDGQVHTCCTTDEHFNAQCQHKQHKTVQTYNLQVTCQLVTE